MDPNKVPIKPFRDALTTRGDAKGFQASLDPLCVTGKFVVEKSK